MLTAAPQAAQIPAPDRDRAAAVAAAEVEALLRVVRDLDEQQWNLPTVNAGWAVRDVVAHVAASYQEAAQFTTLLRRLWQAGRRHPEMSRLDGRNACQVEELAAVSPDALTAMLAKMGPAGVRGLRRTPELLRRARATRFFPGASLPEDRLGYVFDVLGPRDPWMHRIDVCRATHREPELDEHDHEVVALVVRDVARIWNGPSVLLELTGPAGGTWQVGEGPAVASARADALEFLWRLSGRPGAQELDLQGDGATVNSLARLRVEF